MTSSLEPPSYCFSELCHLVKAVLILALLKNVCFSIQNKEYEISDQNPALNKAKNRARRACLLILSIQLIICVHALCDAVVCTAPFISEMRTLN